MNIKGSVLNLHILAAFCLVKCIREQVSEIQLINRSHIDDIYSDYLCEMLDCLRKSSSSAMNKLCM